MTPESHQRHLDHLRWLISKRKHGPTEGPTDLTYLRRLNLGACAIFPVALLVNWREYSDIQAAAAEGNHAIGPISYLVSGATCVMALIAILHLIRTHRAMELFRLHNVQNVRDIPVP